MPDISNLEDRVKALGAAILERRIARLEKRHRIFFFFRIRLLLRKVRLLLK